MSMHTPGPWEFSADFNEIQAHIGMITICELDPPPATTPAARAEWEANIRLIVAAPELLAALELAIECIGDDMRYVPFAEEQRIRAAIAKARGDE